MKHLILALTTLAFALPRQTCSAVLRDGFQSRNLGPFRGGAWDSYIAVPEAPLKSHLYAFYVAAASGRRPTTERPSNRSSISLIAP